MKRWAILGAVGCLALLAAVIMTGVGQMAPPVADANGTYSISGYVWDDTDVDGVRDGGEGSPEAHPGADVDVNLHLCAGEYDEDDEWDWWWDEGCREEAGIASTSIDVNGRYEFTGIPEGDFTVCLDITPPTEWTLDMVRLEGDDVDPGYVGERCFTTLVGTGAPTLDWGVVHIASELSVSKVCSPTTLNQGEIACTITATNEGETILFGPGDGGVMVEDYYRCDDFGLYGDPPPASQGEDEGWCWAVWDVGYLDPDDWVTIDITLSPEHTTGTAQNCVVAAAWNVIIPGVEQDATVAALFIAEGLGSYYALWEDVVAPDRCVNFGEPERHRRATSTPVPTATPTAAPPPTATKAPPPVPTATPYGGPAGAGISPPATGTGLASQGVPNVAWWLASFGTLTLGLGASVALAFRKTR